MFDIQKFIAGIFAFLIGMFLLLVMLHFTAGCSAEHHLVKSSKHIEIAKRKGAVIKPDTVWHYKYSKEIVFDTITNTYKEVTKKDSSFTTITNVIAPGMSKQERKALEDYYKHLEKMMKLQNDSLGKALQAYIKANKQNNKTERVVERQENKSPWVWPITIGLIVLAILLLKLDSIISIFKK